MYSGTISRASARERKIAAIKKMGVVQFSTFAEGFWQMKSRAPCQLLDPGKFAHFCRRQGMVLPRLFNRAIVTAKELDAYATFADRQFRKAFDQMLYGGGTRWVTDWQNIVVNEGLDHLLDVTLSGGTQDTTWFVGLLASSPSPAASWTATEIASNDFVDYSESNLQAFTDGGVSGQSLDNSGSTADFSIDTNSSTIGGAYLIGTNAKATPSGTLYAAGAFSGGDKSADSGDTLSVTNTFTAS